MKSKYRFQLEIQPPVFTVNDSFQKFKMYGYVETDKPWTLGQYKEYKKQFYGIQYGEDFVINCND